MAADIDSAQAEALLRKAEDQVKEAMAQMSAKKRACYDEACEKCPSLVKRETHAIVFLRYCDYDAWKAAERLAQYWEDRCKLFKERAFLPMTQTGEGALSGDDLMTLHAGFIVLLPPSTTSGKDVVFLDRTKSLQQSSRETLLRCFFYLYHVLSEKEQSQTKGVIFVVLFVQPRIVEFDPELVKQGTRMLKQSLPVKLNLHLVNCLPKAGKRDLVQSIVQRCVGCFIDNLQDNHEVHMEESKAQLKSLLASMGIQEVPSSAGGNWAYEDFTMWCRQRATQERISYRSAEDVASQPVAAETGDSKPPALVTADKNERKRLVNVIHSRQKRERRKAEQKIVEEEAKVLEAKKRRLLEEQRRLEDLLSQANAIVSSLESNASIQNSTIPVLPLSQAAPLQTSATTIGQQSSYQALASLIMQWPAHQRETLLNLLLQNNPNLTQQIASHLGNQAPPPQTPPQNQNVPPLQPYIEMLHAQPQTHMQQTQVQTTMSPPIQPQPTFQNLIHSPISPPASLQPQSIEEQLLRTALLTQQQQATQQQQSQRGLGWLLQQQQQQQQQQQITQSLATTGVIHSQPQQQQQVTLEQLVALLRR